MNFKIIISILLFLSTLVSCNEYRKILKTPGYDKKLTAALEYYDDEVDEPEELDPE